MTVVQLARMGATLANNGRNPSTGEQVVKPENVPYILSTMTMAGLYDGSGGWAWKVGLFCSAFCALATRASVSGMNMP